MTQVCVKSRAGLPILLHLSTSPAHQTSVKLGNCTGTRLSSRANGRTLPCRSDRHNAPRLSAVLYPPGVVQSTSTRSYRFDEIVQPMRHACLHRSLRSLVRKSVSRSRPGGQLNSGLSILPRPAPDIRYRLPSTLNPHRPVSSHHGSSHVAFTPLLIAHFACSSYPLHARYHFHARPLLPLNIRDASLCGSLLTLTLINRLRWTIDRETHKQVCWSRTCVGRGRRATRLSGRLRPTQTILGPSWTKLRRGNKSGVTTGGWLRAGWVAGANVCRTAVEAGWLVCQSRHVGPLVTRPVTSS